MLRFSRCFIFRMLIIANTPTVTRFFAFFMLFFIISFDAFSPLALFSAAAFLRDVSCFFDIIFFQCRAVTMLFLFFDFLHLLRAIIVVAFAHVLPLCCCC